MNTLDCLRCGAPLVVDVGLGEDGQMEEVIRCVSCGTVEAAQRIPVTRAEVRRRIGAFRRRSAEEPERGDGY